MPVNRNTESSVLFSPHKIGGAVLKNRFIKSSTAESMAGPNGEVTPNMHSFYEALAKGGLACILLGHSFVQLSGRPHPRMTGLHDDQMIAGMAELAKTIQDHDCKVFAQINHGGSRIMKDSMEAVGPSALTNPLTGALARELSSAEIDDIIAAFASAASRARRAGLDGVQIHAAHGYLVSSFTSPKTNQRQDQWGGGLEGRARFLLEVYRAVRREVGADYPVAAKLGIADDLPDGLSIQDGVQTAGLLAAEGIDAIEISGGLPGKGPAEVERNNITNPEREAYFRHYAQAARQKTGQVPLILVGGMRSLDVMENVVERGWADFVSMARALICEPALVKRFAAGSRQPALCLRCSRCKTGFAQEDLRCRRDEA